MSSIADRNAIFPESTKNANAKETQKKKTRKIEKRRKFPVLENVISRAGCVGAGGTTIEPKAAR